MADRIPKAEALVGALMQFMAATGDHDSGAIDSGEPSDTDADATKFIPCPECER